MNVLSPEAIDYSIGLTGNWVDNCLMRADGTQDNASIQGTGIIVDDSDNLTTSGNILAATFDTNVAAAGVTLSGTTLAADGTDANIDINITPKGTGTATVTGSIKMVDGNQASGYVMTCDANGVGTWQAAAGGGDFSDGGEAGGADRTIGNTDNYDLGFLTNNVNRLQIQNDGTIGVNVSDPCSLVEIWDDDAHPVFSITAAHNTDYDPQIQFRTDATDTVKCSLGVDASDDSLRLNMGSGVGGATHFIMDTNGGVKFQNSTDSTTAYQWLDADGGTPVVNVDTVNERVGIGTGAPAEKLDIVGNAVQITNGVNEGIVFQTDDSKTGGENAHTFRGRGGSNDNFIINSATNGDLYFNYDHGDNIFLGTDQNTKVACGGTNIGATFNVNADSSGESVNSNYGMKIRNGTAATNILQQWTPGLTWSGRGWSTDSSSSREIQWRMFADAESGALPDTTWRLEGYNGAGNFVEMFSLNYDTGGLTLPEGGLIANGNVGIGTTAPDADLEINNASGGTIRLTYNDSNGSATDYAEATTDANGGLTITTTDGDGAAGHINFNPDGNVGINEASPETLVEMTSTAPYFTSHNSTEENIEGGRECIWRAKGEKQDGTEHTLGQFQFSHDGTGDDYKADFILSVNQNGGADTLVEALRIDSAGLATITGSLDVTTRISSGTTTVTATGPTDDLDVSGVNTVFIDTSSNNVTIGGFTGGVDGQVVRIVVVDATNNAVLEHAEGTGNQDIYLHSGGDETMTAEYGGWKLVNYGGNNWYDASHD